MDNELDWDHLLSMASRHRLMPLLYVNLNSICPEKVPENVLHDLKDFYLENTRKNLLLTSELVKVMKLLEDNGIDAVTYKGPVLASSVYGNVGYRQFGDIDILTDQEEALKAKELIISEGYKLHELNLKDSIYLKLFSEFKFINKTTETVIEVNWKSGGMFFYLSNFYVFNNLKRINLYNHSIPTFNPLMQLLMLCMHSSKHDWSRLSWICDISEFIRNENINWSETLNESKKMGLKRILLINLFLAKELFGTDLPYEIEIKFNSDPNIKLISNKIKKWIFLEQKKTLNIPEKLFLHFKRREKIINTLKECFNLLTKPNHEDFEIIPLPENLFILYRVLRPILLLKRKYNL